MQLQFHKYQGAGNDFILIDNREGHIFLSNAQVALLCNRHFGIGADGLILLENEPGYHFKMVYYNSDGRISTMCGNGGRCITKFAMYLGIAVDNYHFIAADGPHEARPISEGISLKMSDVTAIEKGEHYAVLNTGSPHWVQFIGNDLQTLDILQKSREIRNSGRFKIQGINVNWVQAIDNALDIRTYERGVEDETLACGTGVTAAAIANHALFNKNDGTYHTEVITRGGKLAVKFNFKEGQYSNIYLIGPAEKVFSGEIELG